MKATIVITGKNPHQFKQALGDLYRELISRSSSSPDMDQKFSSAETGQKGGYNCIFESETPTVVLPKDDRNPIDPGPDGKPETEGKGPAAEAANEKPKKRGRPKGKPQK